MKESCSICSPALIISSNNNKCVNALIVAVHFWFLYFLVTQQSRKKWNRPIDMLTTPHLALKLASEGMQNTFIDRAAFDSAAWLKSKF